MKFSRCSPSQTSALLWVLCNSCKSTLDAYILFWFQWKELQIMVLLLVKASGDFVVKPLHYNIFWSTSFFREISPNSPKRAQSVLQYSKKPTKFGYCPASWNEQKKPAPDLRMEYITLQLQSLFSGTKGDGIGRSPAIKAHHHEHPQTSSWSKTVQISALKWRPKTPTNHSSMRWELQSSWSPPAHRCYMMRSRDTTKGHKKTSPNGIQSQKMGFATL